MSLFGIDVDYATIFKVQTSVKNKSKIHLQAIFKNLTISVIGFHGKI